MPVNVRRVIKRLRRFRPRSRSQIWSIGIYAGDSPFTLASAPGARNPVLTAADVTDLKATFVADPFMLRVADAWHMFFEVMDAVTRRGVVGHATSVDALAWTYRGCVLAEPFHLSYPHVFEWEGAFYMVPESKKAGEVRLYRATDFPTGWRHEATLLRAPLADCSPFRFDGR
jgi:hypothetical protein